MLGCWIISAPERQSFYFAYFVIVAFGNADCRLVEAALGRPMGIGSLSFL